MEQKEKKKKKSSAAKGGRTSEEQEAPVSESEDSSMAWFTFQVTSLVVFSYYPRRPTLVYQGLPLQVSNSNKSLPFQVNMISCIFCSKTEKAVRIQQCIQQKCLNWSLNIIFLLFKRKSFTERV